MTTIIKGIQKINDMKYLDAIEANYSHEQMTPLNCIIGNSKIVLKRLNNQLDNFQRAMNEKNGCYNYQGADMAR